MRKVYLLAALVLSVAVIFTSCGSKDQRIDLSEGWLYSTENPESGDVHFKQLDSSELSNLHKLLPEETGYVWLRNSFKVPSDLKNEDLAIYLGRISMADSTDINGYWIGGEGKLPPYEFSAWNVCRLYNIPKAVLNEDTNVITVKIYCHGEGALVDEPFISLPSSTKAYSKSRSFFNSEIYLLFAFFMLIIAGYHYLIYIKRPVEKENLTFALLNLLTTLYLSVFYIQEIPGFPTAHASFLWYQKIFSSGLPFAFPMLVTSFINNFQGRKETKPAVIIRTLFMVIPMIAVLFAPDYPHLKAMQWTMIFLVPPMIYLFVILVLGMKKHGKATRLLLIGFSPLVLAVIADVWTHVIHSYQMPYFSAIGWQIADITLLLILANRFAVARNQAEFLNHNLGKKVAERTKKLSDMNAKLEAAKLKADRDYSLAEYVQQNAYQRKLSALGEWDVAFYFKPLQGISGDLYHFFTSGSELKGVGLFDATGHGIATGLVTMLSKNIIERMFKAGKNEGLNLVMQGINNELVKIQADGDSYVSGVLLRIEGDKIEYVNAGHPKIFLKRSDPNSIVESMEVSAPGASVLGIEGYATTYRTSTFKMESGDTLLLYTDALLTSRNTAGGEFGYERITKAFQACGTGTAQDKLNSILSIFNFYTKEVPLKDDLTVIVLQKK